MNLILMKHLLIFEPPQLPLSSAAFWVPGRAKSLIRLFLLSQNETFHAIPENPSSEQKSSLGVFREYWRFKSWCRQASLNTHNPKVTPKIMIYRKPN